MSEYGNYGDSIDETGEAVEDAQDLDPVENLTSDDPDEAMQTGYNPPDREPRHLRDAPTPAEEREASALNERLAQEQTEINDEATAGEPDRRAGRLVSPDEGAHQRREAEHTATDPGPAGYASSAEEAAVHVRDEAPSHLGNVDFEDLTPEDED